MTDTSKSTRKLAKLSVKPVSKGFVKRLSHRRKRSYLPVTIQKQLLRQSSSVEEILSTVNDLSSCTQGVFFVIRRDCIFLDELFYTQKYLGILAARLTGRDKAFSERQVRRALVILKDLKLVAVQSRKMHRGKHMTNIYTVADFFHLPEIKNALDKFLFHFRSMTVVSLKYLISQSFFILRSSFGFWQNVLLNKINVLQILTLSNYRKIIESLREEKVSAPQMETSKSFYDGKDFESIMSLGNEEESFLMELMRKAQYKAREELNQSISFSTLRL